MLTIKFYLTAEKVNHIRTGDWRALERMMNGGSTNVDALANICAELMVDENNQPLTLAAANAQLDELRLGEWEQVGAQLHAALSAFAVPKETDAPSSSPSTA